MWDFVELEEVPRDQLCSHHRVGSHASILGDPFRGRKKFFFFQFYLFLLRTFYTDHCIFSTPGFRDHNVLNDHNSTPSVKVALYFILYFIPSFGCDSVIPGNFGKMEGKGAAGEVATKKIQLRIFSTLYSELCFMQVKRADIRMWSYNRDSFFIKLYNKL